MSAGNTRRGYTGKCKAMKTSENNQSLAKDIGILLLVWIPLLFCIIGGLIWLGGGFDGTIMEELFLALFWGFIMAFVTFIIAASLFPDCSTIWWILAIVIGVTMVILNMCHADNASMVVMTICFVALGIIILVRWIRGDLRG